MVLNGIGAHRPREVRTAVCRARVPRPLTLQYGCTRHARGSPGCSVARLRFRNGSELALEETAGLLRFFRDPSSPSWIKLVLAQQDSVEHSYSKPESLRTVLPLTTCPAAGAAGFRNARARPEV